MHSKAAIANGKNEKASMTHYSPLIEPVSSPAGVIGEISHAHDDLVRLSALLDDAFHELLTSFSVVQLVAAGGGNLLEIERCANRAITALQCGDLANQLIGVTQKRLVGVRETLKIASQLPQIAVMDTARATGSADGATLDRTAPVQPHSVSAGTIELF